MDKMAKAPLIAQEYYIRSALHVTRASIGDVLAMDCSKDTTMHYDEVLSVARASATPADMTLSRHILPDDVIDTVMNETAALPPSYKPSMLVDCEAGRPMEVEVIVGTLVRRARIAGVYVPMLEVLYASLTVMQEKLLTARTGCN